VVTLAEVQAENERLRAELSAVKKEIIRGVDSYCDKIVCVFKGQDYQFYRAVLTIPDPLPDNYTPEDTYRTRLTPEQAVDNWFAALRGEEER
jgi:hypothetical protein